MSPHAVSVVQKCSKIHFQPRGSAPDPTGGALSAPRPRQTCQNGGSWGSFPRSCNALGSTSLKK